MYRWQISILLLALTAAATPQNTVQPQNIEEQETDSPYTRKLLGSSVVTSVSVIMDHGNGTKTYITDGNAQSGETTSGQLGRPPQAVGTPGTLLAPDRYEFYTFGKEGELVKKLMTLDQIQSLIAAAGGDDDDDLSDQPVYYHQPLVEAGDSEGVNKVLESVHNVLKGELEAAAAAGQHSGEVPLLPDQSWTILLPGLLNNDMELKEPMETTVPKRPSTTTTTTTTRPSTTQQTTTKNPPSTARFPPRRTTTTAPTPSLLNQYGIMSTSFQKPEQTSSPPNRYSSTVKIPNGQHQPIIASSSILTPQYAANKVPTSKPSQTPGISTTVKYSAHYTTPHPTVPQKYSTNYVKPQTIGASTKPGSISVKKPVINSQTTPKPTTSAKFTHPTTTTTTTAPSTTQTSKQPSSVLTTQSSATVKKTTTAPPPITTYKGSTLAPLPTYNGTKNTIINNNYVQRNATTQQYKPTTYKPITSHPFPTKYTENQRPSGLPTIVHYLPMQSLSPSDAPVPTSTTAKYSSDSSQMYKQPLTTQYSSGSTTLSSSSNKTTTMLSTTPVPQKETPDKYPSTATVSTKNHFTVSATVDASTLTTMQESYTTKPAEKNVTTTGATSTEIPMETVAEEEIGDTVSVVTILEETTKPIEIMTTPSKISHSTGLNTNDNLVKIASNYDNKEILSNRLTSTTARSPPSTVKVQLSTRPAFRNNITVTTIRPSTYNKSTTSTPPRRGSVTYTPLPELYKATVSTTFKPTAKTTTTATTQNMQNYIKTTVRPTAATVKHSTIIQRKPTTTKPTTTTTTTTTTTKPTTTTTAATTTTTESTTATTPAETTTYQTKIPYEEIPLKLYDSLKDTNTAESTVTVENFSTMATEESTTISATTSTTADSTTMETTIYSTAEPMTTYTNRLVIVNNSEPFLMKQGVTEQKLEPTTEETLNETTVVYTTLPTTTTTIANSDTTTIEPLTTFKDQVLEEGINAVTSILLNGDQKKEFLINMTKPLGLFNNFITTTTTTTEKVEEFSNNTTTEDSSTTTETTTYSDEKSETRLDEIELTEKYEEVTEEQQQQITSTTKKDEINGAEKIILNNAEDILINHNQVKKHVQNDVQNAVKNVLKNDENFNETIPEKYKEEIVKLVNTSEKHSNESEIKQIPKKPLNQKTQIINETTKKPLQQDVKKPQNDDNKKTAPALIKPKPTNQKPTYNQNKPSSIIDNDGEKVPVKLEMKNHTTTNDVPKKATIIPTKESKLNPDTDDEPSQSLDIAQQESSNPIASTTVTNPPTTERSIVHEQIKLQEVDKSGTSNKFSNTKRPTYQAPSQELAPPVAIELHPAPYESMGLEASTAFLAEDVRRFADLCNELAFKLWTALTSKGQISSRSLVMSPFAVTSLLAMVFLGARGATSGQMNDILRLDDMVTFNPHQVLQNVTDSVLNSKTKGVATAAFVRELYSDKSKGKLLDFYKERAQQYYQGHVEEINFNTVGDIIRRRTNLLVKRQTLGKVAEYLRGSSVNMKPPLAAFSANIFQTDCELGSTEGRDGEMYFVVRPSTRQRRLVPVPAVVWRQGFLAGYEPGLDATSVCLGPDSVVSTILILPGQQGQVAPGDGLSRLEQRLIETSYRRGAWSRLLRSQLPRPGLELQVPRFSHRSVLNVTGALTRMGLRDLFGSKADLRGLNGLSNDLHLSDMVQVNTFSTCGEETVGARHHIETYPASPQRTGRIDPVDSQALADMLHDYGGNMQHWQQQWDNLPLPLRSRQARLPDNPRLRFDRPFLYIVRHNPSGIILHMGRFNPRLLP